MNQLCNSLPHSTITLLLITILLFGCKKDPCKDVDCLNGGTCIDGTCQCAAGFEGSECDTESRQALIGTYDVVETCGQQQFEYEITIEEHPSDVTRILITNIGDFNITASAVLNGNLITIDSTQQSGYSVSGSGTLGQPLVIDYTLTTTAQQTLTCTMECTKRP